MKRQQKVFELRTAAKVEVEKLKIKIAHAERVAAEKHARLMLNRAAELEGLEAGSTERFDVLAKYRAMIAEETAQHAAIRVNLKFEIQQVKERCEQQCAAAEDDTEPETEKEQPQQDTVYCDGSEHSARIVARRLINKMPHIINGGSMSVSIIRQDNGEFFVSASEIVKNTDKFVVSTFSKEIHNEHYEAEFVRKAREMFRSDKESGNSHVAEPLSRALDAVFGGNPVEQVDNLIADTVKSGKEGGNE